MEDKVGFDSRYLHINLAMKVLVGSINLDKRKKKTKRCAIFLGKLFHTTWKIFPLGIPTVPSIMTGSLVFMTKEKANNRHDSLPAFDIVICWHLLKPAFNENSYSPLRRIYIYITEYIHGHIHLHTIMHIQPPYIDTGKMSISPTPY